MASLSQRTRSSFLFNRRRGIHLSRGPVTAIAMMLFFMQALSILYTIYSPTFAEAAFLEARDTLSGGQINLQHSHPIQPAVRFDRHNQNPIGLNQNQSTNQVANSPGINHQYIQSSPSSVTGKPFNLPSNTRRVNISTNFGKNADLDIMSEGSGNGLGQAKSNHRPDRFDDTEGGLDADDDDNDDEDYDYRDSIESDLGHGRKNTTLVVPYRGPDSSAASNTSTSRQPANSENTDFYLPFRPPATTSTNPPSPRDSIPERVTTSSAKSTSTTSDPISISRESVTITSNITRVTNGMSSLEPPRLNTSITAVSIEKINSTSTQRPELSPTKDHSPAPSPPKLEIDSNHQKLSINSSDHSSRVSNLHKPKGTTSNHNSMNSPHKISNTTKFNSAKSDENDYDYDAENDEDDNDYATNFEDNEPDDHASKPLTVHDHKPISTTSRPVNLPSSSNSTGLTKLITPPQSIDSGGAKTDSTIRPTQHYPTSFESTQTSRRPSPVAPDHTISHRPSELDYGDSNNDDEEDRDEEDDVEEEIEEDDDIDDEEYWKVDDIKDVKGTAINSTKSVTSTIGPINQKNTVAPSTTPNSINDDTEDDDEDERLIYSTPITNKIAQTTSRPTTTTSASHIYRHDEPPVAHPTSSRPFYSEVSSDMPTTSVPIRINQDYAFKTPTTAVPMTTVNHLPTMTTSTSRPEPMTILPIMPNVYREFPLNFGGMPQIPVVTQASLPIPFWYTSTQRPSSYMPPAVVRSSNIAGYDIPNAHSKANLRLDDADLTKQIYDKAVEIYSATQKAIQNALELVWNPNFEWNSDMFEPLLTQPLFFMLALAAAVMGLVLTMMLLVYLITYQIQPRRDIDDDMSIY